MNRTLATWATLGLLLNALAWGLSWWPFRELQARGWHPLWTTAIVYGCAVACLLMFRPRAWRGLSNSAGLWLLALAAGLTNLGFNWAVTLGDVVRVVLLFYLMPAWSILLAWAILGERPTRSSLARVALALLGVGLVLKTPASPWPWPSSAADGLAIMGGFCFALNNALLRRMREKPSEQRTFAMFFGGMLFSLLAAGAGALHGSIPTPIALDLSGYALMLGFALFFLVSNLTLQYGAARLQASTTSLIMLNEILIATASSVLLGAAQLSDRVIIGGLLIIAAGLWAAWQDR